MQNSLYRLTIPSLFFLFGSIYAMNTLVHAELRLFPHVTGTSLTGQVATIPTHGNTLILLAFTEKRQPEINTWLQSPALKDWAMQNTVYEIPLLPNNYRPFNTLVRKHMMSVLAKQRDFQKYVIPVYADFPGFCKKLGIVQDEKLHVFNINKVGNIISQEEGYFTIDKWKRLRLQ